MTWARLRRNYRKDPSSALRSPGPVREVAGSEVSVHAPTEYGLRRRRREDHLETTLLLH